ncbi:hypothetical protein BCAR13_20034 [Paraburkholderia caribensis]|nr:hypothetical protein BCAR13_20034 [Paraburkholderia caribensis]
MKGVIGKTSFIADAVITFTDSPVAIASANLSCRQPVVCRAGLANIFHGEATQAPFSRAV